MKTGIKQSPETIAKRMAHPNLGKTLFKKGHSVSEQARIKIIEANKNRIPWNKGLKGFRAGEKHNWMPTGDKHWNWKGGVSREKHVLSEPKYKSWRLSVFTRDKFKCRIGNEDCVGQLEVHHILRWKDYHELRYQVNNGITLCHAHHPRKKSEEKRLSPYFQTLVSVSNG